MTSENRQFTDVLKAHKHSVTQTRLALFTYLHKNGLTATATFIADNLNIADQASLYRSLSLFKKLNIIEERIVSGKRAIELSDRFSAHHHHLTCRSCGSSTAFTATQIEQQLASIGVQHGFSIEHHTIELEGICEKCRATT